ncbi:substrate-binding domain-containing protein [uncultured Draconibacterium sp.]|uniref:hybrid sensor histidine kinase/response regulator transcription factor n=1 Tax=uncultured Draconibacterium sp. TaxID=1573823 RepID=UPI002AA6F561|nr:substrate-binding domain-containing protein [uncultured Draconibacterium sp.]
MNIGLSYMTKKRTILFLFLLFISICGLTAKEKYTIGFSQCGQRDNWRLKMEAEMERELLFHPDLSIIIKQALDDSETQIKQINELMNMGIDLLIVSPNEINPIQKVVEEVYHKGIPVVLIDRRIDSENFTAYVGGDNYEIGQFAAEYIGGKLNYKGNVMEIQGAQTISAAAERSRGFNDVLAKYENLNNVYKIHSFWSSTIVADSLPSGFAKHPDIKAIFAFNDGLAEDAVEALNANKLSTDLIIVGVDGLPTPGDGIEMVENGTLTATIIYPTGGKESIQLASKILHDEPFEKYNSLFSTVVDESNVRITRHQFQNISELQLDINKSMDMLKILNGRYHVQQILLFVLLVLFTVMIIFLLMYLSANKKLKQSNINLGKQKNEISSQNAELMRLSNELEEATKAKLRFFTNMSHEFRTPLTLIVGPLENMIDSADIPERFKKQVSLMHKNALRLLHLINQLMDFRKIENNKMQLQAAQYDVVSFLNEVIMPFYDLAEKKKIAVLFDTKEHSINAWFDMDKLDKVVFNLLSNAIKFTPVNGSIKVSCSTLKSVVNKVWDEELEIKVADTGNGIPPNEVNHIFDRFYQAESSHGFLGTGLGLSLSKEFVDLHHGKIEVKSEVGKGTTFTIRLPLGDQHLSDAEKIETPVSHSARQPTKRSSEIQIDTIADRALALDFDETPTILLVEDEKDVREYIKDSLHDHYRILQAENGKKALEIIREEEPDLIVSDIMMPEMDGLELTRTLKTDLKTCHIPIILLTAKTSQEQKLEGLEEGADSYIPKPFNSKHLQIRVKKLLELRKKMQERYKGQLLINEDDKDLSRLDRKFLNKISKIVEEHLEKEELTVEELSQMLGLSRVHVYRKIKKLTGMSVSEFVRSVKLKLSLNLIKTSGKTMAEIAYEVGFSSPSYFTKCFKDQFGMSPSEFGKRS